jgi:hypothetical protein
VPVALIIIALRWVSGATSFVTMGYSAPESIMKIIDWPLTFILTVGSRGPSIKEPGFS